MDRLLQIEQELAALATRQDRERALQALSPEDHAALAARQRIRLAGRHESEPVVNQESREIGLEQVSQVAAVRAIIRVQSPELKPDSPAFLREVHATLKANENAPSAKKRL
jgi:hypothetical protein